ncbi:hypothetical protein PMAYCL1PPCAC_29896, partial [Pristionchus mayeri]
RHKSRIMPEYSYGVVVEKYSSSFGVWLLFRGARSALTSLNNNICSDPIHLGDIVRATTGDDKTSIRRIWPFPDSVWSDGCRVVARSIVSFDSEVTINRGTWKDDVSGLAFILLVSRDLGVVIAPVQWYNREFYEAKDSHLLAYAQFIPRKLINMTTDESIDVFWSIIENRISLPVGPSKEEDPAKFLNADYISNVPVLTVVKLGNWVLTWSYALGDRMAIIKSDGMIDVGKWLMATVIPSSPRDFKNHGCAYTVVRKASISQYTQPKVRIDHGKITMIVTLNSSQRDQNHPETRVKLWHDRWGLPVRYEEDNGDWIGGEANEFRATVEVLLCEKDDFDGRRVSIRAIGPAEIPRLENNGPMADSSPITHPFEDVDELKAALVEGERMENGQSEWNESTRKSKEKKGDEWHTQGVDKTTSIIDESEAEWKKRMIEMEGQQESRSFSSPPTSSTEPAMRSGFSLDIGSIPIRAHDDSTTEEMWTMDMEKKGWKMPIENLISKRLFEPDGSQIKKRQCLITKVRFDVNWQYADKILLFLLDGSPSYIVHDMEYNTKRSIVSGKADFTTVGNVVEVNVGRGTAKFCVHDEMWRLVTKVSVPMRETIYEPGRVKSLELIVTAKCLSPETQNKHNDRHRYDKKGFTMFNHQFLHNIAYYGGDVDAREFHKYTYQMVVQPEECIKGHAFWKAKEILWKIHKETSAGCGSSESYLKPSVSVSEQQRIPRPIPMSEIFEMFTKLMESEKVMEALHLRTGTDYKKKFLLAMEVAKNEKYTAVKRNDKRDLDANANFLISIVENAYSEEIFKKMEERRLWKLLVKTVTLIKEFRNTTNERWNLK